MTLPGIIISADNHFWITYNWPQTWHQKSKLAAKDTKIFLSWSFNNFKDGDGVSSNEIVLIFLIIVLYTPVFAMYK